MAILLSIVIVSLGYCMLGCRAELLCPQCDDECDGAGFMSCETCLCQLSCKSMSCGSSQICILQSMECVAEPCFTLPQCVPKSNICHGGDPLVDAYGNPVICTSSCPGSHNCMGGFCCLSGSAGSTESTTKQLTETIDSVYLDLDNVPETFFGENDKESENSCPGCPYSPCGSASCPGHLDAICEHDNCSCLNWFVDSSGNHLSCSPNTDGIDPFDLFPELKEERTEEPVKELETGKEEEDCSGSSLKYVVISGCTFIALVIIGFIMYKVIENRKKSTRQSAYESEGEQKVPLREVAVLPSENNNANKPLQNNKNDEITFSTDSDP